MPLLKEVCKRGHLMRETRYRGRNGESQGCSLCRVISRDEWRARQPRRDRCMGKYGVRSRLPAGERNRAYFQVHWQANKERLSILRKERRKGLHRGLNYRSMMISLLYQRDGNLCGLCGDPVEVVDSSVDHIVQLAEGGSDEASNLRLTHLLCNLTRPRVRRVSNAS